VRFFHSSFAEPRASVYRNQSFHRFSRPRFSKHKNFTTTMAQAPQSLQALETYFTPTNRYRERAEQSVLPGYRHDLPTGVA
jgi:hypothetical protein